LGVDVAGEFHGVDGELSKPSDFRGGIEIGVNEQREFFFVWGHEPIDGTFWR
jgi:hypothetical protein